MIFNNAVSCKDYSDGRPRIFEIHSWERNFGLGRGSKTRFVKKKSISGKTGEVTLQCFGEESYIRNHFRRLYIDEKTMLTISNL